MQRRNFRTTGSRLGSERRHEHARELGRQTHAAAQGTQRSDARDVGGRWRFIGTMPERDQGRQARIHATEILMAAAERGRSIEEATDAIDAALFLQGKLELRK
jgi:hypothetical protein